MLSIMIISGPVALVALVCWGRVRLRPLELLHTLQTGSHQVGSEVEKIFREENISFSSVIYFNYQPILALATLEIVLMVFRIEFFPANPRPAVTRDPPAKPENIFNVFFNVLILLAGGGQTAHQTC